MTINSDQIAIDFFPPASLVAGRSWSNSANSYRQILRSSQNFASIATGNDSQWIIYPNVSLVVGALFSAGANASVVIYGTANYQASGTTPPVAQMVAIATLTPAAPQTTIAIPFFALRAIATITSGTVDYVRAMGWLTV